MTAYVANLSSNSVTPIDTSTNIAGTNIDLPSDAVGPDAIAIGPDGTTAYVANQISDNVTPIDLSSKTAEADIRFPAGTSRRHRHRSQWDDGLRG